MTNPYYNYNVDLIPTQRAESSFLDQQFEAIEDAFDLLGTPSEVNGGTGWFGTDTGTADAYVVDNGADSTLEDGELISFVPTNTNTGPSTIAVNGGTALDIIRNSGEDLQAGDLIDGVPVILIYDETNTRWVHVGATALQCRARPGVKTITADYTLTADDEGYIIRCNSSSDITVTIPSGLPVGYIVHLYRFGTGELTVSAGSGVVLRTAIGPSARSQYSSLSPACVTEDDFLLLGDAKV